MKLTGGWLEVDSALGHVKSPQEPQSLLSIHIQLRVVGRLSALSPLPTIKDLKGGRLRQRVNTTATAHISAVLGYRLVPNRAKMGPVNFDRIGKP